MVAETEQEQIDQHNKQQEARVSEVLDRAVELSKELKTTVSELSEMLRSSTEERGSEHRE